jgi:hypothetical protein
MHQYIVDSYGVKANDWTIQGWERELSLAMRFLALCNSRDSIRIDPASVIYRKAHLYTEFCPI